MTESKWELSSLKELLKSFPRRMDELARGRLIVVGDIGLDEYVLGDVRRISPEAPVPVLEVQDQDSRLGLAANVAQNVASLGGTADLVSVVGQDAAAEELKAKLRAGRVNADHLVVDTSRPTTRKLRVMSGHHHIVRVDYEHKRYISAAVEDQLIEKVKTLLPKADGVVIEDYAKGALSERALQELIAATHKAGKLVFVDPHRTTPVHFYNDADVITPNRDEAVALSGLDYNDLRASPDFILELGRELRTKVRAAHLVITRGPEGMTIFDDRSITHMSTFARQVFDVTGAGDTVIAALALATAAGFALAEACVFANVAAGVVVGKIGCVPCTRAAALEYINLLTEEPTL